MTSNFKCISDWMCDVPHVPPFHHRTLVEVYCSVLGAHAVHVAMAGYTGIVVGKVDERFFAPIEVGMTR